MPILTIVDTVAVQNYVFASNRLKESVGASELIKRATKDFVLAGLQTAVGEAHNVSDIDLHGQIAFKENNLLEDGGIQAELIYAGGGNTVLLFNSPDVAKAFARTLSEKLLTEAPGIEVAIVHHPFEWLEPLGGYKSGVMFEAFKKLEEVKRGQSLHRPLAGLGVTTVCDSTGQVATTTNEAYKTKDETVAFISAETAAKLEAVSLANKVFAQYLANSPYDMPLNFDNMGRSRGDSSYIAVVHIDGNGMGKKVEALSKNHTTAEDNRPYLNAMRQFSQNVFGASWAAFHTLLEEVMRSLGEMEKRGMQLDDYLPFRPLIVGGDDLTFVCDGRLALTLSEFYLGQFEKEMKNTGNSYLKESYACAGIAVVKSHYPFARAYQLAEDLSKEAKKWVKDTKTDFSALDWHFAPSGIMADLEAVRKREYQLVNKTNLIMRPIARTSAHNDWRHWPNLSGIITHFQQHWPQGQSKIKLLREAIRQGEEGYRQYKSAYKPKLPELTNLKQIYPTALDTGFVDNRSIFFDAIEAMDFFIPLHSQQGGETT